MEDHLEVAVGTLAQFFLPRRPFFLVPLSFFRPFPTFELLVLLLAELLPGGY